MAFDKIMIYTKVTSPINTTQWRSVKGTSASFFRTYAKYKLQQGVFVYILPVGSEQLIFLSFSVGGILSGDNIASHWCFNINQLHDELMQRTKGVIDLLSLPHLRFWYVSKAEVNFDYIADTAEIEAYFQVMEKLRIPRFQQDNSLGANGTIYFYSNTSKADSGIILKCYKKLKERQDTIRNFDKARYYSCNSPVNLAPGQGILRFEMTFTRGKVKRSIKPKTFPSSPSTTNSSPYIEKLSLGLFEDIVNFNYGIKQLTKFISTMGLDKQITTRKGLLSAIKAHFKKETARQKALSVVDFLNLSKSHRKKPSSITEINYYKNRIQSELNLHYIYSNIELNPISINKILDSLPEDIRVEMEQYKKSNIFRDAMFYRKW